MNQNICNKIILHVCIMRWPARLCTRTLYVNDITQASSLTTTLFADDINLHVSASNNKTLQSKVEDELQNIEYWMRANKLSINYNKTNLIILNKPKHDISAFSISINNFKVMKKSHKIPWHHSWQQA